MAEGKRGESSIIFRRLSKGEVDGLQRRKSPQFPVAENCLECKSGSPLRPWT